MLHRVQLKTLVLLLLWMIISIDVWLASADQNSNQDQIQQESSSDHWEPDRYFDPVPKDDHEDSSIQYIVKYKKGSKKFKEQLHKERRRLTIEGSESDISENVRIGNVLVVEDAVVINATIEELEELENDNDVEYFEKG